MQVWGAIRGPSYEQVIKNCSHANEAGGDTIIRVYHLSLKTKPRVNIAAIGKAHWAIVITDLANQYHGDLEHVRLELELK